MRGSPHPCGHGWPGRCTVRLSAGWGRRWAAGWYCEDGLKTGPVNRRLWMRRELRRMLAHHRLKEHAQGEVWRKNERHKWAQAGPPLLALVLVADAPFGGHSGGCGVTVAAAGAPDGTQIKNKEMG